MNWLTGVFTYFLIWWIALFVVLPFGNAPPVETPAGHMPGAPANPRLKRKFIITSILSAVIWLVIFTVIQSNVFDFRDMTKSIPD
jgi:predicted secreted protein